MEKKKLVFGVGVGLNAIIGKRGIKEEVVNSLARQVKFLELRGCKVFIFVFQEAEYCQCKVANLEEVSGKEYLEKIFMEAFKKRQMAVRVLESAVDEISDEIEKTLGDSAVPVIMGYSLPDRSEIFDIPNCTKDDSCFANICEAMNCETAIFVGNYYDCRRRKDFYPRLFKKCPWKLTFFDQSDFLLKAVALMLENGCEIEKSLAVKKVTGLPYMFY